MRLTRSKASTIVGNADSRPPDHTFRSSHDIVVNHQHRNPHSPDAPPRTLRIAMNGITGRMGYRQHLVRSILPIRDQGGVLLEDGSRVQVEPILLGRNADQVARAGRPARRRVLEHRPRRR